MSDSPRLPVLQDPSDAGAPFAVAPVELDRRAFLLLSMSAAAAGLAACVERPSGEIVPYLEPPPEVTPGEGLYFATSMVLGGYATGLLAESHVGRPTKIEGNPDHPASLGATTAIEQASVLQLYDPNRARGARFGRTPASWRSFVSAYAPQPGRPSIGGGLHFLLEPTGSPTMLGLLGRLRARHPEAKVYWDVARGEVARRDATRALFGRALAPQLDFAAADVVVALDSDFLCSGPFTSRYARRFAERRRGEGMNRLYAVEAAVSVTGTAADHRLRVRPREVGLVAAALLAELGADLPAAVRARLSAWRAAAPALPWIAALARDLRRASGRSVIVAGEGQPPVVHALAYALNEALGNAGKTVHYTEPALSGAGAADGDLAALAGALRAGRVDTLVILADNPAYTAPADLDFAAALGQAKRRVYLGLYENETARLCNWFLLAAHPLEAWGDARAYDGTVSFVQPLIAPLFQGRTATELLAVFTGELGLGPLDLLRAQWTRAHPAGSFDAFWEGALRRGFLPESAHPSVKARLRWDALAELLGPVPSTSGLELVFREDTRVHDGRFGNNAWLQELPDPITKLTWDNAVLLSPATAAKHGVASEDRVAVRRGKHGIEGPALVVPGQADDCVVLTLGYGRDGAEAIARQVGVNVYPLRTRDALFGAGGATLAKRPGRHRLAITQGHFALEGRSLALEADLAAYRRAPELFAEHRKPLPSLRYGVPKGGLQWGMVIDLGACTGCSACVVACQAENNTPVVGRTGVLYGREMHWLRIDRYRSGAAENPRAISQPMLCQHCENAPCEYVCPVNATTHSPDGLNEMTYNRCVGTRFCSNNCPYKVRRFNWFNYHRDVTALGKLVMNPDVTVRARGVMEKCTYCVQRIRAADVRSRIERRPIRDGEVVTACQQACPTGAITFGAISDPQSAVARARAQPRLYNVLHELNTVPRTQYLARIRNPNPEIAET